jgi:hypothetical protein
MPLIRMTDFDKKIPNNKDTAGKIKVDNLSSLSGDIPVYEIHSFHSLTQFIGFGKYLNRMFGNVYLRGQTSLYEGKLTPSALRPLKNAKTDQQEPLNYAKRICEYKNNVSFSLKDNKNFCNRERIIVEPLLQHYGIKTCWLDVVDNVWVALWFALHKTHSTIVDNREYVHFYENDVNDVKENAYILLLGCDAVKASDDIPGIYRGTTSLVVDLRKAVPSYFLRPHAQHALMVCKTGHILQTVDYSDMVIAIAKISVSDGLHWIGQTGLLSVQSLFPPPYYDTGYASLLNEYHNRKNDINFVKHFGSIQNISY